MRMGHGVAAAAMLMTLAAGPAFAGADANNAGAAPDRSAAIAAETEASRKVLEGFLALMAKRQFREALDRYAAKTYIQHDPDVPPGLDAVLAHFQDEIARGAQTKVDGIVAEGNMVGLHMHRTFADGSPTTEVIEMWRIEDGKFAEHWSVTQNAAVADPGHLAK